jgi:hypothetical protein
MLQYLKHNNTRCQRGGAEIDLTDMGAYLAAIGGGGQLLHGQLTSKCGNG